jgi:outer membrane assembly lipoprotein YfiO
MAANLLLLIGLTLLVGCASRTATLRQLKDPQLLARAKDSMAAKEYAGALECLDVILERPDAAKVREEALLRKAHCYIGMKDYDAAFESIKLFVEEYPLSRHKVEKPLFGMGVAIIDGANSGFLGIPGALGFRLGGTEVLRFLIKILRRGERAVDAQRIIAQYYFDQGDHHRARLEYEALIEDYPGSIFQSLAEYRIPLCRLLQSRGPEYDRKLLEDALRGFQQYEHKHPGGTFANLARNRAKEVYNMLAEKNFRIADFYLADKRVDASVFYHELTINTYPETPWAQRSVARLGEIAEDYPDTEAARVASRVAKRYQERVRE